MNKQHKEKPSGKQSSQNTSLSDRKLLLLVARDAIVKRDNTTNKKIPDSLKVKRGVFVTLTENNELRGCIGNIIPNKPLFQSVIDNAILAAYEDPRFFPLTEEDFPNIHIEISILSEPKPLQFKDEEDLLAKLHPNFGVIIKKGFRSATFLPQVWKQLPDKEDFLRELCLKAGLKSDSWKQGDNDLRVETYFVEKFEE